MATINKETISKEILDLLKGLTVKEAEEILIEVRSLVKDRTIV